VNMFSDDNQEYMNISTVWASLLQLLLLPLLLWPDRERDLAHSGHGLLLQLPCDQTPKGQEGAARAMGVPSFGLDRPYKLFTQQPRPTGGKSTRTLNQVPGGADRKRWTTTT